jgi:PleD family two-component response regulator
VIVVGVFFVRAKGKYFQWNVRSVPALTRLPLLLGSAPYASSLMTTAYRILIVEDMPTQALRLEHLLKTIGVESVKSVQSGEQAISLLKEDQEWDAILSDINMPGMDGFELCKIVKANEHSKTIPFFLLVSLKDPTEAQKAMLCSADNFILKEYDKEVLAPQLKHAIENARLQGNCATVKFQTYFNGECHEVETSAQQLAAMLNTAFEMAVRQRTARVYESVKPQA